MAITSDGAVEADESIRQQAIAAALDRHQAIWVNPWTLRGDIPIQVTLVRTTLTPGVKAKLQADFPGQSLTVRERNDDGLITRTIEYDAEGKIICFIVHVH